MMKYLHQKGQKNQTRFDVSDFFYVVDIILSSRVLQNLW